MQNHSELVPHVSFRSSPFMSQQYILLENENWENQWVVSLATEYLGIFAYMCKDFCEEKACCPSSVALSRGAGLRHPASGTEKQQPSLRALGQSGNHNECGNIRFLGSFIKVVLGTWFVWVAKPNKERITLWDFDLFRSKCLFWTCC